MTPQKKKTPRPRVTVEELRQFVQICAVSESAQDVASRMNWSVAKVRQQATRLRKKGVPIDRFGNTGGLSEADVAELAELYKASA